MDKLKPSQLLRLGSKQVPKCKKTFFDMNKEGQVTAACVIGMITIGYTGTTKFQDNWDKIPKILEMLRNEYCVDTLTITQMNDGYDKSPEYIAKWLESKNL